MGLVEEINDPDFLDSLMEEIELGFPPIISTNNPHLRRIIICGQPFAVIRNLTIEQVEEMFDKHPNNSELAFCAHLFDYHYELSTD